MSSKGQTPWKELRLATVSSARFRQVSILSLVELVSTTVDFNNIGTVHVLKVNSRLVLSVRNIVSCFKNFSWINVLNFDLY